MPSYYKCLRGDSEHLAVMEDDAMLLEDAAGRTWICHPIDGQEVEELPMSAHVSDVFRADATARRQGFYRQGTEVRIYCCEDERELLEKLREDTGG